VDNQKYIAVVGAGYWGKNLVRNYYELGVLHSICDSAASALREYAAEYPGVLACEDYGSLLNRDEVTGVVLSVPAEMHYEFAKRALLAGKHVFVEKPLALKLSQAEELVGLAADKRQILMVGHLMQYHPAFRKLKRLVEDGALGRIYYIYSNRLSLGKIRREENSLWSFAPHDISMILSLCREEPIMVTAEGGNYLQKSIADVTITHMEFRSGVKAHIFVSWLHPFKEQKLVVVGQEQMAVFSDTEGWNRKLMLYSHSINWDNGVPTPCKAEPELIAVEQSEPLRNECAHFLDCIASGGRPLTDGREGVKVLKVLAMAQECIV
jgi:UDP-2-acetamido-3-amino-2,3-dideoxy-glucuronate N-acetyltransferase